MSDGLYHGLDKDYNLLTPDICDISHAVCCAKMYAVLAPNSTSAQLKTAEAQLAALKAGKPAKPASKPAKPANADKPAEVVVDAKPEDAKPA